MLNKYSAISAGARQPPNSRRTVAKVAMHCGANTYQTSSDKPVAKDHSEAMMGDKATPTASPLCDKA